MADTPRIGDIVTLDDGAKVLITGAGGATYGDAHGFVIGSSDPAAQAEVPAGVPESRIIRATERTASIAHHMRDVGYWPSQLPAVNAELLARS